MNKKISLSLILFSLIFMFACAQQKDNSKNSEKVTKTKEEWKAQLTPEEYNILREKGTERAFTGKYYDYHEDGIYVCKACSNELFDSKAKYNSGSGWPSFFQPINKDKIDTEEDHKLLMERNEILCSRCGGHLGHVFEDGPQPTGLRYCVNSASLAFIKRK